MTTNDGRRRRSFGVIKPQAYMYNLVGFIGEEYDIHMLQPASSNKEDVDQAIAYCKEHGVEAVAGFCDKCPLLHSAINTGLGNVAPSRLSILYCRNKYLMRTLEAGLYFYAPVDPMTETDEEIRAKIPENEWPFMLKSTSLTTGHGIFRIESFEQLQLVLQAYRENKELQLEIEKHNASLMEGIDPAEIPALLPPFLAEHIESADSKEFCHQGYVTAEGEVVHYGLCEKVYLESKQLIASMVPPISLDTSIAERMEAWVEKSMRGMVKLGYVNQFFNIDFWIRADGSFRLTEINSRAALHYQINYQVAYGASLFIDNLCLVAGDRLTAPTPFMLWKAGIPARQCTMIVVVTLTEHGRVGDLINYEYVKYLETVEGIFMRHLMQPDDVLDPIDITSPGVWIQMIWLIADSLEQLGAKEAEIRSKIYTRPQPNIRYPNYWTRVMPQLPLVQVVDAN